MGTSGGFRLKYLRSNEVLGTFQGVSGGLKGLWGVPDEFGGIFSLSRVFKGVQGIS